MRWLSWRWWVVLTVMLAGCEPEGSSFGPNDSGSIDLGSIDLGSIDAVALDRGSVDQGEADLGVDEGVIDARVDAAPDLEIDRGQTDAAPLDAAPDVTLPDATIPDATVDQTVDAALDMTPDMSPDGGVAGPLCGDARRLPFDGEFTRVGPVDQVAYAGCGAPVDAWSAFIELDEARLVTVKPGAGRVQLGDSCEAGAGECVAGSRRFELPAGRTDFVFLDTDTVRVRSTPSCRDGADNDQDGRVDLDDPGCARADDWTELERPGITPACANGLDDDGDGRANWPFDLRCPGPGSAIEACRDTPRNSLTSMTPEIVLLDRVAGRPAPLDCAAPADTIEVLLVAPWSGRAVIEVDAVGAQAMEVLRACDVVEVCVNDRFDAGLAVTQGEVLRVRVQGRPQWLRWQMSAPAACANGLDDDNDGRTDLSDPGCRDLDDDTEADPEDPAACGNGVDDDRDRGADFPEDFACRGPGGPTEIEACAVADFRRVADPTAWTPRPFADASCGGDDTPEVGLSMTLDRPTRVRLSDGVGYLRTECADVDSERGCVDAGGVLGPAQGDLTLYIERGAALADPPFVPQRRCGNGVDDDADGQIDTADLGCTDRFDDDERDPPAPGECGDGVDNDDDGRVDWPADPQCRGAGDGSEADRCAGLPEIAPVERFVVLDDFAHLPLTDSVLDGRPVYAALVPFIIDRPALRLFPANPAINWVPLEDCAPDDMRPFGAERRVNADRGTLLMRIEVDVDAVAPFANIGGVIPDCRNGFDDDGDGLTDGDDPGCARQPLTEHDDVDLPECADGLDNDGDGRIDAADLECLGAADGFEGGVCVSDVTVARVTESTTRWVVPIASPRFGLGCGPATLPVSVVVPIDLPDGGRLSVRTVEGTGDPVMSLEQGCDAPLVCADDTTGLQPGIVEDLPAGRYALRVGRWDAADRSPILVVIDVD